ncbi:transposase [bacterium]|nr:transposase [bacterium]
MYRSFLQHVIPKRFIKVRYYGIWHHSPKNIACNILV